MRPFRHLTASSVEEVVSLLGRHGPSARTVAGGTDLLGGLKDEIHPGPPSVLIDLKKIQGLDKIEPDRQGLTIGALVRISTLVQDPLINKDYGLLARAAGAVASPQLRNMGTLGGNLCQEPRCWYYRYPDNFFPCLRKGGPSCPALIGENRYHSVFGAAKVGTTPCTQACPASVDIPAYLEELRVGDWDSAARILLFTNPMPAVTGRVCPHFCQEGCNRADLDSPVSIRSVERRLGDYILDHPERFYLPPERESGRSAAVVGAGPAGLAAAFFLRRAGHRVTVFDRLARPGGMLTHAIPAYRLPPRVVERLARALEGMGIGFSLGREIDRKGLSALQESYEAVFVAPGAWGRPGIDIEGEDLARPGLDFLTQVSRGERPLVGPRVAVIGGGNVAVDVGLTAKRLGADQVTLVCLESREQMPAHAWEVAQAEEEGLTLLPSWGPARIIEGQGRLTLDLVRCTAVFDQEGRFCPAYDQAETHRLEAETVFLAVGQRVEPGFLDPGLLGRRGLVQVDALTQAAGSEGLWAGGDAVTGAASVIAAVASGRRAAAALNARWGLAPEAAGRPGRALRFSPGALRGSPAAAEKILPPGQRTLTGEDAAAVSPAESLEEAGRCFNCGCVAVSPADLPPALIALGALVLTSQREIQAEEFFCAVKQGSTVLGPDEIVTGVRLPPPRPGLGWGFEKFRTRKAIDFPIASVAATLVLDRGRVTEARIVLGAAAPTPLRALAAEAALEGREPTLEAARAAARAAVAEALVLSENGYKTDILKALVERAVLAAARGTGRNL